MARTLVQRAYKFRFYPTGEQAAELSRTFGCVRKVYNLALDARTRAWFTERRRVSYVESSAMLTEWKKSESLAFLSEVSSVPLQQCLRHLQAAFTRFFDKQARYPKFKSRKKSKASAEYTRSAFRLRDGRLTLAKMREPLNVVWSPSTRDTRSVNAHGFCAAGAGPQSPGVDQSGERSSEGGAGACPDQRLPQGFPAQADYSARS